MDNETKDLPLFRLIDPQVRGSAEAPRLSRQCQAILDRLRQGPATNRELAMIALKYTGRISDLRASGFEVEVESRNRETGITRYRLAQGSAR